MTPHAFYAEKEAMLSPFIHLRVRSTYSLLEGAVSIQELVKWCVQHRMPAVAIADNNNLFGSLEFAKEASNNGVQPIHACTIRITPHNTEPNKSAQLQKPDQLLLIAQNEQGWHNLMHIISASYLTPAEGHAPLLSLAQLEHYTDGIIALTGGMQGGVAKAIYQNRSEDAEHYICALKHLFPERLYIELHRHGLTEEQQVEPGLLELAKTHRLPVVATNDAYFMDEAMYTAHDAFICIAEGSYVMEENRRKLSRNHRLKSPKEMQTLFADLPEALENTSLIAQRCSYMAPMRKPILPSIGEDGMDEPSLLCTQARNGLQERLALHVYTDSMDQPHKDALAKAYHDRLEHELAIIIKMGFPGYFLIVSDFIQWAKDHTIPVGPGRGSGAGSLVAWSLKITDLDPIRFGLLFERFLNPERVSMPDFDVDFCQERRDEVIHYVQEKYGRDKVAQIITFGKLQARAVLRDVGRVLQMPYGQVDKICKLVPANPANPVTLQEAIKLEPMLKSAMEEEETVGRLVEVSLQLEGLNRHASTHAAGVVIADRPLEQLVPLYRDPKSEMPVVQYSMKWAESAGLVKFDFLGLKTLTVLVKAVKLIARKQVAVDLLQLPEGDAPTYALLSRGESFGVFQLESAGMRDTLRKLKPDTIEDIIALVSLYRPGPMDNIPTYIARKHGQEKPEYLHPLLEPILKETFGVIIYQEQVMQIAQILAGYSLGDADLLRRAMGKKIHAEMEAQRKIFTEKAVERGVEKKQAVEIFDLIAKFASYGFNKSHAAAYALIAYQTAYLKANHPVEFLAASMTYDMHNTDKLALWREEAARMGIQVLPPDVNSSHVLFDVENGAVRYALAALKNVGEQAMQCVVEERNTNGRFVDIFDFVCRVDVHALNKRMLEQLIKAGAFDSIAKEEIYSRAQLVQDLDKIVAYGEAHQRDKASDQNTLFGDSGAVVMQKPKFSPCDEWLNLEKLSHEFGAIGFYLSSHPLTTYDPYLQKVRITPSAQLAEKLGETYSSIKVAGIITGKKIKNSRKGKFAFIQLSDATGMFEVSIFEETLLIKAQSLLENGNIVIIGGEGKSEEAGVRLIAKSITAIDEHMAHNAHLGGYKQLALAVSKPDALLSLKEVLGEQNGKGTSVRVQLPLADKKTAYVQLPGLYLVNPDMLEHMKSITGVDKAEAS